MPAKMPFTEGDWDFACDSYGKVRHSRKACVYTTIKTPTGDQLFHVASRIPQWEDARLIAAAKDLFAALHDAIADAEFYLANDLGPKSCVEAWLPAAKAAILKASSLAVVTPTPSIPFKFGG